MAMRPEISEELLGRIVGEVFDGAIEDDRVIRDIYRVVAEQFASQGLSRSLADARQAIATGSVGSALCDLYRVILHLQAQQSPHVIALAELLLNFDEALNSKPFLWLEIGFNRISGWMVTIYDKAGGNERVIVQVEGLRTDDTCNCAAHSLNRILEEQPHG